MSPMGMLIRKIQCHVAYVTSQPPTRADHGADEAGNADEVEYGDQLGARVSPEHGEARHRHHHGSPIPCSTREATSMGSEVDRAQSREPRMKKFTAEMKTQPCPGTVASQPLTGMSMATVRV